MKVYRVGGAVRDELLGLAVKDHDWVVVGATPEMLVERGFQPVGRDFPVFLHPETHEEYALARTERASASSSAPQPSPNLRTANTLARASGGAASPRCNRPSDA